MEERSESKSPALTDAQQRVVAHAAGPLLVLGLTGSGRTEAISHRLAALAEAGEGALVLTSSQATATRIRIRAEEAMEGAFEELVVNPYTVIAARLLSEHATEAGLDPFLESLTAAERLALLLERLDELPLRRHEIRGNAAGLLARIVDRIDALKAAGVTAERFREWAEGLGGGRAEEADLDAAAREREFAQIYELHDSMLRAAGAVDGGEAVLDLSRLLGERPGSRRGGRRALPPPDRRRARGRLPGGARPDRAPCAAAPAARCSPATTSRGGRTARAAPAGRERRLPAPKR